jgi:hypothetical protein
MFIGAGAGSVRNPVTIGLTTAAGEAETAGDDGSNSAGVGLTIIANIVELDEVGVGDKKGEEPAGGVV